MRKKSTGFVRFLSLVLSVVMVLGALPTGAMAAGTGNTVATLQSIDESANLTDAAKLQLFEQNMDSNVVTRGDIPAQDEEVRVIVELDVDSLLDIKKENPASQALPMAEFLNTDAALAQLEEIQTVQTSVLDQMHDAGIGEEITYTYTAVSGGFAAKLTYGDVAAVAQMDGVKRVSLCDVYYPDVLDTVMGEPLTDAELAAYANDTAYQGEGMVIGILDTGLDWTHEAFANAPQTQRFTKDTLNAIAKYDFTYDDEGNIVGAKAYSYAGLWYAQNNSTSSQVALLTADDLYKSGKVPFGFDYADADTDVIPSAAAVTNYGNDHGTHVAGIAAGKTVDGEGNVTFAGQAPEAQLAIFKVFSDSSNGASTDTILAALNDAVLLDVDVINMSLGSSGGFGAEDAGTTLANYYNAVKTYGILLDVSAGNAYSSSYGGAQGDYTSASDPDSGIIGSPGSYDASLAVASVNANATNTFAVGEQKIPYNDVSGYEFAALLLDGKETATYEYVMIPGTGDKADYEGLDVTGKIAVVIRGGLSFNDKQLNAAEAGAAGCIIYNNRDGYLLNMSVDNYTIPTVSIGNANGVWMGEQENKTITITGTGVGTVAMSDFSSWGPLPSLELKPEITAPGGSIYSSLPFGEYGYMSGTSMASPYMTGISAAAKQYVNKMFPGLDTAEKRAFVNRLLMSTAAILYDTDGVAYSPRRQGAGMVDLDAAVNTPAYLYVRGDDKTKIELGDDPLETGVYDLAFQVKNLTSSPVSYQVNTLVQTETVTSDGKSIAQKGYELDFESAIQVKGGTIADNILTVPSKGEASVVVTVTLTETAKAYMKENFSNGIYVEGFVELTNEEDPALSVPFLAFFGDWTQAPIFEDADIYNGKDVKMYATAPSGVYGMMYIFPLGSYLFKLPEGAQEPAPDMARASLDLANGNGMTNLYYLMAGMLRGAKQTDMVITDNATGEIITSATATNVRKAYYNASAGTIRAGYAGEVWPALMENAFIGSGTKLDYSLTAYLDTDGAQKNKKDTYSFTFTADSEMPWVVNRNDLKFYYGDDGRVYLDVTFADNNALCAATLYTAQWTYNTSGQKTLQPGESFYEYLTPIVKEDGTVPGPYEEYSLTFDVTDQYKKLTDGCFYIMAYDYAMNQCSLRVYLDEIPVTKVELDQTEVTLPTKGYVQLNPTVTPDNATDQLLTWSSSNEDVAEVREGLVKAIAPGEAIITAKVKNSPEMSATCKIIVTEEVGEDVPMTAFTLTRTGLSINQGDVNTVVQLYAYTPYTATDLRLTWSSSDETVATVDAETGAVTGVGGGTCTITAKAVLGDASASYTCNVTAQGTGSTGSFAIEGDKLIAYSGNEAEVTVPDGIRVIGDNAFKSNTTVRRVILPDTVKEIGYRAFYGCANLESIAMPETLEALGEQSFYNCKKLETFGLTEKGVIPKGMTEIPVGCFYNCNALQGDLVIPEGVTTVCKEAFYGCKALTSVTMADTLVSWGDGYNQFNNCVGLTRIELSAGLTELPRNGFFSCSGLTDLPDMKNVTTIGQACFQHAEGLTEITIPASITTLGGNVFYSCDNLEKVHFAGDPEMGTSMFYGCPKLTQVDGNLTTIPETMFKNCDALVNFTVPDHVTFIGKNAFADCNELVSITFPASYSAETLTIGLNPFQNSKKFTGIVIASGCTAIKEVDGCLYTGDGKQLISLPSDFAETTFTVPEGVESINGYAFYGKTSLTSVTFPSTLKRIGEYAFYGCNKLTAVELPDGVEEIGTYAFYNCSAVTSLNLGKSLTAVEPYAFYGCNKVPSIVLPSTVKTVGKYGFYKCNAAKEIVIPEGVTAIDTNAFYGCKVVKEIILPDTLTEMGTYAFYDCIAATTIDTGSLTVIPDRAFQNCKAVKNVIISDDVTSIGTNAFYYCQVLTSFDWPSKLENIGDYAFYFCRKLQDFDLSGTRVENIGKYAFYQLYEARNLVLPNTLKTIGVRSFAYLNYNTEAYVPEVHIPASVTSIAKDAFYYANKLQNITVDGENPVYASANGILIVKETGDLYIWPMANTTTEFTVPETMTVIPSKMFQNNTSLKKITIHGGVTEIGTYAFAGSKISEFVFEPAANGLTIDSYAFNNCDGLTELTLPYGTTELGTSLFSGCDNLTKVNLPDTVTIMGNSIFSGAKALTEVHLPASLKALPAMAFSNCVGLTEITLPAGLQDCGTTSSSTAFSGCLNLRNIFVEEGSRYFKSVDGVLYDANGKTLRLYPMGRTATSYTIPEGVVRVDRRSFLGNTSLEQVSFPSTLVRIGDMAFFKCENLKDFYFNGTTAPVLETSLSSTGAYMNYANYWNFVDAWMKIDTTTYKMVPNDLGLNLYYPEGATGFDSYVWRIYFQSGSTNVMDASFFTVTDLTAVEGEGRTASLTWTAAKQAAAENVTYTVERAIANHVTSGDQDTWLYGTFETLAQGLTDTNYVDTTALHFGMTYAYRVSTYSASGETGPAAVTTLVISAEADNADEQAAQAVIQAIEALKPIENLTGDDADKVAAVRAAYEALTDAQKALVPNLDVLEQAEEWIYNSQIAQVEKQIAALPDFITIEDAEAIAAARSAYDALTDEQKSKVSNYDKLLAAEARLAQLSTLPFTDVPEDAWYREAVTYVYQHGLMNGTATDTFSPEQKLSRCMMITVLYRMAGEPAVAEAASFTDVSADAYYAKAVAWAEQIGLTNGYPDGTFRPDNSITRAEMVTMLCRYAQKVEGKDTTTRVDVLMEYVDANAVPDYAVQAMAWAVENGIINSASTTEYRLAPEAGALREQVAAIVYRYLTNG